MNAKEDLSASVRLEAPVAGPEQKEIWGSDAVAAMLREMDIPYLALNPGASYRGLHDSLVNHLGNARPQVGGDSGAARSRRLAARGGRGERLRSGGRRAGRRRPVHSAACHRRPLQPATCLTSRRRSSRLPTSAV